MGYSPWGHKESDTTEQLKQILKNSPIHMKMKNVSSKIKDDHYKAASKETYKIQQVRNIKNIWKKIKGKLRRWKMS